ncbi:hypothetical protein ACIS_00626 [Anaplasma centrale str. Israel]|uniref:Uncharacterized protein n=1 Tax=Anaplasma centrale (strain Israel) TaxID=574556 RepID=D1AUI4_ANACI|nr:hypothetical protein [Anaplasma centrale]ACZ49212.1 hypothetical protein ACIS_00626 [Anaplasma centrale str. Israel]
MSELFLSFCSSPSETNRCEKLRNVLVANPGLQRNLLAVISLTENGVLKIGQGHEFSGCRVRFAPPDDSTQSAEEVFFVLDTDLDSELSTSLARLAPDSVRLAGASIEEARLRAGVSVIVSNSESVRSLFSFIVHIIDSGMVLSHGDNGEELGVSCPNVKRRITGLMRSLFGGSKHAANERNVLTSVFECYLDYYLERAIGYIAAGGYDSNGDSAWELDPSFLHATLNGRALLHDEITTGILSRLQLGQAFIAPTWSSQARHRAMLLSAVLRAINELPQNVKDEVKRDSSTRQRSSINFLCACGIAIYTSGHYVSARNAGIRIRNLLQAMLSSSKDHVRYDEAAGMLAISRTQSPGKKYNKELIQELMDDARFARVYQVHDTNLVEGQDLLLRLKSRYKTFCDLIHSCGGEPPSFSHFCTCSFFESLLPALERCGGFQITLPLHIDSCISGVRTLHGGTAFGQYIPAISDLDEDAGVGLSYRDQDAGVDRASKFDDVRVRKVFVRAAAVFVVAAAILCIMAALYFSGVISAHVMAVVGVTTAVIFVLAMVGLALSYARGKYGVDVASYRGTPTLTLCVSVRDRGLFKSACEQESISRFGITEGKLCMEGRPVPTDKYVAHVLGADDEVPHGTCILFGINAVQDSGDLELIRIVSNKSAWPEGSTTDVSFTECPYMGVDTCNVRCSASGKWSSRAGHIILMKALARAGRVGLLLSYLDAYVDFMCSDRGRGTIDPKFRTSKQWKLLCRDHAEHDIITAIYKYCGMYLDQKRKACLEYITALLQVHDVRRSPERSHAGVMSRLQHKYVNRYVSNLYRLANGPEFPFSDVEYRLTLAKESGITFDTDNWFLSQMVPVRFTKFVCADDRTLIYPQGSLRAGRAGRAGQHNNVPFIEEEKTCDGPQRSPYPRAKQCGATPLAVGYPPPEAQELHCESDDSFLMSYDSVDATYGDFSDCDEEEVVEIYPNFAANQEGEREHAHHRTGASPQHKRGPRGRAPTSCGVEDTAGKIRVNSYQQQGGAQGLRAGGG